MAYQLKILPLAARQTVEAYEWYESLMVGLGDKLAEELYRLYNLILQNPEAFSYWNKPIRQAKVPRFPFVIVYEVQAQNVIVTAVFNTHQDPDKKNPA